MTEERRRYFRINDSVGVAYRVLGPQEAKIFAEQTRQHGHVADYAANFDNRIGTLLESCRIQSPIAAELIDLINKKLNFVIHQMDIDAELMQKVAYSLHQVNISACGLAFNNKEALTVGDMLQLDMVLHPGELYVVAMAKVIACEPSTDTQGEYFVRLNFEAMNNHDQELLIQHIVKQQSAQLKQQRLRNQTGDP
jgi:hypothetical protein